MRYTLTWLPKKDAFCVCREDEQVAYIPAATFRSLVSGATRLRKRMEQAERYPGKPVRFEQGAPVECAENYQRSLVRPGTEDAASLRLKRR